MLYNVRQRFRLGLSEETNETGFDSPVHSLAILPKTRFMHLPEFLGASRYLILTPIQHGSRPPPPTSIRPLNAGSSRATTPGSSFSVLPCAVAPAALPVHAECIPHRHRLLAECQVVVVVLVPDVLEYRREDLEPLLEGNPPAPL